MKEKIKSILTIDTIEEIPFLHSINNTLLKLLYTKEKNIFENRKEIDIFNFIELAKPTKRHYPYFYLYENNMYGLGRIIFKNLNLSKKEINKSRIEHGLFLGDIVHDHYKKDYFDTIITFSNYRKERILKQTNKNIICVGPYIKYADNLLTKNELNHLKKKIGKTLLVFPSHSIETVKSEFDVNDFINHIDSLNSDFDTVIVCMFWKDIELGRFKPYLDKGYKITSAGYVTDYYFMDRLKTIISLADSTLSNNVGTHVGYCIYMKKPHYIYDNKTKYVATGDNIKASNKELTKRIGSSLTSYQEAKKEIMSMFSTISYSVSEEQIQVIKKYWGDY